MRNKLASSQHVLTANTAQARKLESLKATQQHLGNTGKGWMIDDAEVIALAAELATKLGTSKRAVIKLALLSSEGRNT